MSDVTRKKLHQKDPEKWMARGGVALRVFVYVFATHLFAGFIRLLFYVGEHAPKCGTWCVPRFTGRCLRRRG